MPEPEHDELASERGGIGVCICAFEQLVPLLLTHALVVVPERGIQVQRLAEARGPVDDDLVTGLLHPRSRPYGK